MKKQSQKRRRNICTRLQRHLGHRTVLGVALPILKAQIAAAKVGQRFAGLTQNEIEAGFEKLASTYIKSDYHSTYVHRRLGPRGFLEVSRNRYKIRETLLHGVSIADLEQLHTQLVNSLQTAYEQRQAVIRKLEETCSLPHEKIEERHALVDTYLSQLTGSRGEMFEVVSFAVLREYFRTFGFSLQRFSTTHANDGGMDFVGGEAIYQVTTDESIHKIRRDLAKAPGTKRVLVRPSVPSALSELSTDDVLETIEIKDLLNHFISWLLARDTQSKKARHLQEVLKIALSEFRRENKAESVVA